MKRAFALLALACCAGCDNYVARNFGGTVNIDLPPNTKLITATWKQDSLWYLVRPMRQGEAAEESALVESSAMGVMEGRVVFRERVR